MNTTTQPLLLSLNPYYANLIFAGRKKAELRRRIASGIEGRDAFIYVSSPVKQLRGGFRVGQVWQGSPEEVWNEVSEIAGVDKRGFDAYYEGREIAYALQVTDVWEYENPVAHGFKSSQFTVETAQELIDLIDGELLRELDNVAED